MENPLEKLAEIQINHSKKIVFLGLFATFLLALGLPNIQLQTDFQSSLPDDLPEIKAQEKVESQFQSSSSIIILFQTSNEPLEESFVTDVRDPRMIKMQKNLAEELESESMVSNTQSPASLFQKIPENQGQVVQTIQMAGGETFFNRDYTATQMYVNLEGDMSEENVREATELIQKNLEQTPKQPGIDITVTGNPVIRTDIGDTMVDDSITTISAASLLILVLLTFSRGRIYGPITFVPLFIGLIWTLGTMGILGIPLTIATIALGAMILGLGVEYGSFITERIIEEKQETGSVETAIKSSVPTTGLAILGSSTTTVVGFSALLIATISFIRNLGLTLALGIVLTLISALVITPALIIEYERWSN